MKQKWQPLTVQQAIQSDRFVAVRRRIFRQLIESLIYEGMVSPETEGSGGEARFTINGRDEAGLPVVYTFRGQRRFTFGRIRLSGMPIDRTADGMTREADSLSRFLLEIRGSLGADEGRLVTFIHELEQTLFKDALAQYDRFEQGMRLEGCSYDILEGNVMDGHPYHPSYKSRIGFDYADHYAYGPEFKQEIHPLWLAAYKEWTRAAVSRRLEYDGFMKAELGARQLSLFTEKVRSQEVDPDDYVFLPVHPWQWQKQIAASHLQDLREKRLIVLGTGTDAYRPQQSIRTLANRTSPGKAYLKLSMSILNTSTGRVLAPHTVENAPAVSDWLKELAAGDPFLHEESRLILLGEVLGISYDRPALSDLVQSSVYGTLGCIWRESLHSYLEEGEEAVPFNALCATDLDGRPFIEPWVRAAGIEHWLKRLLEAAVLPIVHLLYAHGIALESHAQNMVLIHKEGVPCRVALKDFHDGVRFSKEHLFAPEKCPDLLATPEYHARVNRNSFIEADDPALVRDFVHDALFFINLGELALFMADHFLYEEREFWSLVRQAIEGYQRRFPELRHRYQLFDLFAPSIEVEQLTKRRLFPDTELRTHRVGNPLNRCAETIAARAGE
ncbi:IucA/IucC family protein [uncultured Paenibacillus sp.]|uniref:IucA/IucC family protein n=1 Tax=uncultured Paenibacillus sp. TaxID=227322 RepID=UPI0028D38599|nr:IucA/IucC family protein [uncultured Paenibacillus sp.]